MTIPVADPKRQNELYREEIEKAIGAFLDSGWYILGSQCKAFENEFAAYVDCQHCVGVANGTDAIQIALRAADIGIGDEVITTAHTANATVTAIELCGAVPVLADIDSISRCLCPDSVSELISGRTKAIVAVHIFGQPADVVALKALADEHGLILIEDCAQAHGATVAGKKVGSFGHFGTFSFYPTKILAALGDGGAVVCNDDAFAEKLVMLRQYGWREKFRSEFLGMNSRLDELQAAVLRVKLKKLDQMFSKRAEIAERFSAACEQVGIIPPAKIGDKEHAFHLFVVETEDRERLRAHLEERGIGTALHYSQPIHLQPAYVDQVKCSPDMSRTETLYQNMLTLPLYAELCEQEIDCICAAISEWEG